MNTSTSFTRFIRALCGVTLAINLLSASTASAIVGYVNSTLYSGYTLVANPLDNTTFPLGNTITNLFGGTIGSPSGVGGIVLKWTGSGYSTFQSIGGEWFDANDNQVAPITLAVGEGAVVFNQGPSLINTFIGEVRGFVEGIGHAPVPIPPAGIYLRGSIAPLGGSGFADVMGRAPQDGDAVLKLDTGGNPLFSKFMGGVWQDPSGGNNAPTLFVGEAAFFDTTGNQFAGFTLPTGVVVPEPTSIAFVGIGGLLLVNRIRSRKV